jgi:hypothetical protein
MFRVSIPRETKRAVICTAIKQLRTLEFFYHGGFRTVEPYALGLVIKGDADNESLVCYQTEGFNDLHEVSGWKLYRMSEMEDMEILKETFKGDRPGYDPDTLQMRTVICCVRLKKKLAPEIKLPVITYIPHNEVMAKFRYSHPAFTPALRTEVFPDPLLAKPFSKPIIRPTMAPPPTQILDIRTLVEEMA